MENADVEGRGDGVHAHDPPRRRQGHPLRMHVGEKTGKFRIETQWIGQEISPELSRRISKKNLGPSCC